MSAPCLTTPHPGIECGPNITQFAGELWESTGTGIWRGNPNIMATTTELDGPTQRRSTASRTDSSDAVHADSTRADRIRRAQRHSKLVRLLRFALPAGVFIIAAYYALTLIGASNIGSEIARTAIPKIIPSGLTMKNPRYRGFTKEGGAYLVTAESATPELGSTNLIQLAGVTGDLTQKDGATMALTAKNGVFDSSSESVVLTTDVQLKTNSGGWARMEQLRVESRTGLITSDQPVEFGNPQSKITGQKLRIMQKSKEVVVTGNVVALITPPAKENTGSATPTNATAGNSTTPMPPQAVNAENNTVKAATSAPAASADAASTALTRMFTGDKGPIEITSDRLEIDDIKKTAIFVGKVVVKQGDATMTTPELRIAYNNAPSAGLTGSSNQKAPAANAADVAAAAAAETAATAANPEAKSAKSPQSQNALGAGAKINSIVAANPVTITQAPATHITSTGAAFDAATQRATLAGDVVITRAPDTRITGHTAGFDDSAGIAYIDGDVVIVQGTDRRATSKHAEFNSKNDTAIMTGDVVLIQGKNELRGKRLFVDQKAGHTELTSPPMSGEGPGRISGHFIQSNPKPAQSTASTDASATSMMGSFRTDPSAPIDITANQLEVFDQKKLAVFRGDVEAKQGTFNFRSTELQALYSGSAGIGRVAGTSSDASQAEQAAQPAARLTRLQARGKVVVTSLNGQNATGDWADFDVPANTVTLGGDVVLSQGRNVVKGTRLVINMTTGESVIKSDTLETQRVTGDKPGDGWRAVQKPGRPSAVFFPQDKKKGSADAASGATKSATKKSKATATSGWQSTTASDPNGN